MSRSGSMCAISERSCLGPYVYEIEAPESFYRFRPRVMRPVFLAGCGAFGFIAAGGLAPHLGQATTFFFKS